MAEKSVEEAIKWGAPVYTVDGKNVLAIAAFKNHAAVWFYQGVLLKEKTALLEKCTGGKDKSFAAGED